MSNPTCLSLFSGIGGFDLAAQWVGVKTTQFIEIDSFCQKVLKKNFPGVAIHDDITTYTARPFQFDFITFGSPCQDLSGAGKQKGIQGDRSGLFFHAVRLIEEVRPLGFIMENVIGAYKWLPEILNTLIQIGDYHIYWFTLSVAKLGGCHKRERFFCVGISADSQSTRSRRTQPQKSQARTDKAFSPCSKQRGKETIAGVRRKDDGFYFGMDRSRLMSRKEAWELINSGKSCDRRDLPNRGKRIKALGNAVTPQQAYIAWLMLFELMEQVK